MATFDGWEDQLYGPNTLAHFRTKGSKNGVRRFQNEDGTWTPLGLKERKEREGWGDRKERRTAKRTAKVERRAQRAARIEAYREQRKKNNPKNMSDEELQKKIARLKMEQEYRELAKSPLLKAGEKLAKAYFEAKDRKLKQENERMNLMIRDRESKAKLANAKAANVNAKSDLIDNLFSGKGKKKAKAELIKAKADNQVRGAIRKAVSGIITKEGRRIVNDMGEDSRVMKVGRGIKKAAEKSRASFVNMTKNYMYRSSGVSRPSGATNYTQAGAHPATHPTSGKKIKRSKGWKKK